MKIAVCGDSFMAVDPCAPKRHFSEILAQTHEVINLACPGVGNIDICYQIKEAITRNPDWVIIGTTDPARIELPYINEHTSPEINISHFRDDSDYQTFKSTTIPSFIGEEPDLHGTVDMSAEKRKAVKMYLAYIYNYYLKSDVDSWAIGYWLTQLDKHKIKYNVLPRDFCIYYDAGYQGKVEPWSFHTNFESQEKAAKEIEKIICPKN